MWFEHLQARLDDLAAHDLTRRLRTMQSGTAPRQRMAAADGGTRELLLFCSNDYLGLAAHPAIADALTGPASRLSLAAE